MTAAIGTYTEAAKTKIGTRGTVSTDRGLSTVPSALNWGNLYVGSADTENLTITNNTDEPATLSFTVSNWVPANATDYLGLSWNYDGAPVPAKGTRVVSFTLTVFDNVTSSGITDFSNSLTINGSGGE